MSQGPEYSQDDRVIILGLAYALDGMRRSSEHTKEVQALGLDDAIDQIEHGVVPEEFPWVKTFINRRMGLDTDIDHPGRVIGAGIGELQRLQSQPDRDFMQEARVVELIEVIEGTVDEYLNHMGFLASLRDKKGKVHGFQYASFQLDSDERWIIRDMYRRQMPVGGVETYVPPAPRPAIEDAA